MSSLVTKLSATQTIESLSQGGGNDGRSLVRPYNAAYYSGSGTETGYLKITLPESWNNDMLMMTVDLYMYGEGMTSLRIGGYSYATSSTWSIGPQAHIVSTSPHSNIPSYKVEYGHDGTFMAIYISHASQGASSTWTYPQVVVRDVHLGFSSVSDNMAGAWDIEFTATLGTITATKILTNDNPILGGGSGSANKVAYWSDTESLTYDSGFHYENNALTLGSTASSVGTLRIGIDGSSYGIGIYDGTGTTFRLWRDADIAYITRGADVSLGLALAASGNFGFGTANPSDKLHVYNDNNADTGIRIQNINTGTSARARLYFKSDAADAGIYLTSAAYNVVSGWADRFIINTDSSTSGGLLLRTSTGGIQLSASGTNNPDIYVNTSGNVGIGQSLPSYKLDITGTARITSTLVLSGLSSGTDNTVLILNGSNQVVTDEIDSRVWGSSLVDGSGSANQIAFWTDSNTITGESWLYWDASNDFLGINTSSPEVGIHNNSVSGLLNYRQHFFGNSIYSYSTGILIATSIQTSEDSMFELSIEGNSYFGSFGAPIMSRVQGYNYVGGGNIIQTKAISNDPDFTIDVFHYGGYVYFHFEQTNLYQTYTFKLICPHRAEKITSITNAIKPVSGVTNSVTITPAKLWTSAIDGSGSGLDADLLDGYHLSTTRNAANTVPVRDSNGYLQLGWINTTSGETTSTINKIYASNDDYIRYVTPATLISQLGLWTSANDGSGSGLDADTLDGVQGASYLRSDANDTFTGTLTANHAGGSGSFALDLATNDNYASMRVIRNNNSSGNQDGMYIGYGNTNSGLTRIYGGGSTTTHLQVSSGTVTFGGNTIWHAGNDGSGSGLDADLIDGIQGSDIVRISQTQTITGAKTFNDGPYLNGTLYWRVSSSDAAIQRADARDDATNFSRLHWYGMSDAGATSNFRHAWYDGSAYINVTASNGAVTFDNLKLGDWSGGSSYQGLFHANQTSSEYVIMSNDIDTFISSTTGGDVHIRGGGNISTHEIRVSPSARATASGSSIVIASDISGSTSYIPKYTGSATLGISALFDDNGNIAIGTTTASGYKLNVNGSGRFASDLTVAGNLASVQSITASGTITFSGLAAGTDNSVVVLHGGTNQLITDEIDPRVWGSSLVDGSGSTSYISKWSDGNTVGNSLLYDTGSSVGLLSDSYGIYRSSHILSAGGGRRATGGGSADTGYIKITLPNSWTNTMVSMYVDLFEYATYRTCSFYLAGYTYSTGSSWYNTTAIVHGDYKNTNVDYYKVEFAHDGSKCCIYISKTELGASSVWSYPYITVRDVTANHSSTTYSLWDNGWIVSGTDDGTGKTTSSTQNVYQGITRANVNGTANYLPRFTATNHIGNSVIYQSGSFIGIGTTSPSEVLEVNGDLEVSQAVKVAGNAMIEAISSGTNVYVHGRIYNNGYMSDGIYLNYNSAGTTAAHLRFYANGTSLRGWVDASTGNWILGSGTANSHKLLVEGTTKINTSLGINGDAGTYSSKLHIVGDGTNPNISVSSANIDTSTSSSGRTFYGWMPIKVEGTTRYIPLYS